MSIRVAFKKDPVTLVPFSGCRANSFEAALKSQPRQPRCEASGRAPIVADLDHKIDPTPEN